MRLALAACVSALSLSLGCAALEGARLYQSGSHALDRGDTLAAIADLERAAERVPHASEIHNHLGIAYARAGRHEDALRAFERAADLDCDNAAAQANLRAARAFAARQGDLAGSASPAPAGRDPAPRAPAAP
jgi:tetratricopeptide (TPR) repeat protein